MNAVDAESHLHDFQIAGMPGNCVSCDSNTFDKLPTSPCTGTYGKGKIGWWCNSRLKASMPVMVDKLSTLAQLLTTRGMTAVLCNVVDMLIQHLTCM